MKMVLSMAAATLVIAGGAMAGELPTFEVSGFPISQVQAQLVGTGNVREKAPSPDGASASPHQISVLTPRVNRTAAANAAGMTTATGFVTR